MDWKRSFLESSILGRSTNKTDANAVQSKCVDLAYRDMMTAGRFYSSSFLHSKDEICSSVIEQIKSKDYKFSRDIIKTAASKICNDTIGTGNRFVTGYGLAQKITNMTFKYLYVFSDLIFTDGKVPDFSSCDCPLDSIILGKASLDWYTWSKLRIDEYEHCQEEIAKLLKENPPNDVELTKLGNMAFDLISW